MRGHLIVTTLLCLSTVGCVSRSAYNQKEQELLAAQQQNKRLEELAQQFGSER